LATSQTQNDRSLPRKCNNSSPARDSFTFKPQQRRAVRSGKCSCKWLKPSLIRLKLVVELIGKRALLCLRLVSSKQIGNKIVLADVNIVDSSVNNAIRMFLESV